MPTAMPTAGKRYVARFAVAMSAYVVTVLAGPVAFPHVQGRPLQVLVAVAPALAIVGVIWAVGRYLVEETDEYLRMRLAQIVLLATGITLSLCTVWGFLESYGLVLPLPAYDVFPLFCGVWGISQLIRRMSGR